MGAAIRRLVRGQLWSGVFKKKNGSKCPAWLARQVYTGTKVWLKCESAAWAFRVTFYFSPMCGMLYDPRCKALEEQCAGKSAQEVCWKVELQTQLLLGSTQESSSQDPSTLRQIPLLKVTGRVTKENPDFGLHPWVHINNLGQSYLKLLSGNLPTKQDDLIIYCPNQDPLEHGGGREFISILAHRICVHCMCLRPTRIFANLPIKKAHFWMDKLEKSIPHKVNNLFFLISRHSIWGEKLEIGI